MRMTVSREFYVPAGAVAVKFKDVDAVAYLREYEVGGKTRFAVTAFAGKAAKPVFSFYYTSAAKREEKVTGWIAGLKEAAERKKAASAARNAAHDLMVGDIFYTSWGYEQTNVDFFEVVEVPSAKMVVVEKIGRRAIDGSEGFMCCRVVADPTKRTGEKTRHRVNMSGGASIKISSCETGWKWDGAELGMSWYA